MGAGKANPPIEPREPPASERLESWKEIANYLKRGVRTIQRGEKQEGLPVHRHVHEKRGTVYASKPEIVAWWQDGRPRLEQQEQIERASRRRLGWAVAAAVVVVAAAGVGLWLWLGQQPALPFEERDWVLIASFENRTGEAVFDGTLEYALERELSNSQFVNVIPRERINDTLQLMKKPLDTSIDAAVGREVALRDGGIRALITGRVEKLDTTYLLSATLVDPVSGVSVASFSEEAVGQREVVPALRRLSSRVRNTLGEKPSFIQESEQKLEKVTTPSLRALQLYSRAAALNAELVPDSWHQSAELLRQAVTEDPEFASAHIMLADYYSTFREYEKAALHFQRAFELAERVPDRERYLILGAYYGRYKQDYRKAAQVYQLLLSLYPDDPEALSRLASQHGRLGQRQEADDLVIRRAELRPRAFRTNVHAAYILARKNEWDRAEVYYHRAREVISAEESRKAPYWAVWFDLFPARNNWARGDVRSALEAVDRVAPTVASRKGHEKLMYSLHVGHFYLTLGKLETAEKLFQYNPDVSMRHFFLAEAAWVREDRRVFKEHVRQALNQEPASMGWIDVVFMARAGFLAEAAKLLRFLEKTDTINPNLYPFAAAEVHLARREREQAKERLREGLKKYTQGAHPTYLIGSQALAHLLEKEDEPQQAIGVLEEAAQRSSAIGPGGGFFRLKVLAQLAQLYRKAGQEEDADQVERELRKQLAYADPDHPILLQLKRAQDLALAQSSK